MKLNYEPVNIRSERAVQFRRRFRSYKIGFFSLIAILAATELEFDLSNQIGSRVRLRLNSGQSVNQSLDCHQ